MPEAQSIPALDKITYKTPIPGYNVSFTLLRALGTAEAVLPQLKSTVDAIIAKGVVKEVHKDVHPWLEYDLPCDQYAQMMVRFDVFQAAQEQLKQLLGVYMSLPVWTKPPLLTEAQWRAAYKGPSSAQSIEITDQRKEFGLGPGEWPDMQAIAAWSRQRAILFRTWHDLVAKYIELAFWATNIQPIFMFPGQAQKQPTPEGWFTSGLGVPSQVRDLLASECAQRGGGAFSYWQDNPGILGGSVKDSDRKAAFYQSFHLQTHSWFPGHPASAAIFAPFRRGVDVLKLVRGERDGMVWEAVHWDELDRYQNLNHRAFPVHAYEAWAGPESMRPGMVPKWIGAYPTFMLDYARAKMGKAPIPWSEGDHPLDGENTHFYTPHLSRMVINKAGEAAIPNPPTKSKRRRRRFRRMMRWMISPGTAMIRDIEDRRDQEEPQKSIVNTLEFIDALPDAELENLYWETCAVDGEKLDEDWLEAWEDPRKYHLGARLRDVRQEIRRANALVPVTTMGPRMRLKWARAWAQGVAYQDAAQTFREAMNMYFDGHITFFTARGDLELDAATREAMAIAKAKANGEKVTMAIGAVASLAAAINPIAGAIVAVVAALVGLFTNLFGGSVRADNFRLAPQTPVLRQPRDPNACIPPEEAAVVADIAQPPAKSPWGLIAIAAATSALGYALLRKKKP